MKAGLRRARGQVAARQAGGVLELRGERLMRQTMFEDDGNVGRSIAARAQKCCCNTSTVVWKQHLTRFTFAKGSMFSRAKRASSSVYGLARRLLGGVYSGQMMI
jgi:hypothetical protein